MDSLEIRMILVTEEVQKLKELEDKSDYFRVKELHSYARGGARARYDFYEAKIEIDQQKGSLCENTARLFVRLKEFVDDTLELVL